MRRRSSSRGRGASSPRPYVFISEPLERKRRGLPVISGSEWRMYKSDEEIAAIVDQEIERQKFFGSLADQKQARVDRFYSKYFSSPDFEMSAATVRQRVFFEAAQEWDFDNPGSAP